MPTSVPHWTSNIHLSLDDKVTSDDILISSLQNGSALNSGEHYRTIAGDFVLRWGSAATSISSIQTDAGNSVDEWPNDTNIVLHKVFVRRRTPFWTAWSTLSHASALSFEGNQVTVSYTLTNKAPSITDKGTWAEQVWLTTDKHGPSEQGRCA